MVCKNKKRMGIIFVISGILTMVIGLLSGRFITTIIKHNVEESVCISSKDHSGYKVWTNPPPSRVAIYFWNIRNKEGFLHNGETPQLEERGPYVYWTHTKKIDVLFDSAGRVTYKTFVQNLFDNKTTAKRCSRCKENDLMTVLNIGYLGMMAKFNGDTAFSLGLIPLLVSRSLHQFNTTLASTLTYLGVLQPSNQSSMTPAFGPWLASYPQFSHLIYSRQNKSYNTSEMLALYNVLANTSLLLPPRTAAGLSCKVNLTSRGCGLITYLTAYATMQKAIATVDASPSKTALIGQAAAVKQRIDELLCPSPAKCLLTNNSLAIPALLTFITTHLTMLSMAFLDSNNYGLVITRSQKELALGYIMNKLPQPPTFPHGIPVKGFLTHHYGIDDARRRGKSKSFYTCSSTKEKRFTWAAYDGKTEIPSQYYPNLHPSQRRIQGYANTFAAETDLTPCTKEYKAKEKQYELFLSKVYLRSNITFQKPVTLHGLYMNRYLVNKQSVKVNNVSVFMDGVIDVSSVFGFPVSNSLAGFLHGDARLHKQLKIADPKPELYESYVDIEPVTGKSMNVKFRFQLNSVITSNVISVRRPRPLNITFTDDVKPYSKHFPVMWTEYGGEIDKTTASLIKKKVFGAFGVACSVTMLVPALGGIGLLTGIVLLGIALKRRAEVTNVENVGN